MKTMAKKVGDLTLLKHDAGSCIVHIWLFADGGRVKGGIELNTLGYHVWKALPGDGEEYKP